MRASLTTAVTFLLIAAIHTVSISITAPANGDAVAILALELVAVTFDIAAVLRQNKYSVSTTSTAVFKEISQSRKKSVTSSEPSAQS